MGKDSVVALAAVTGIAIAGAAILVGVVFLGTLLFYFGWNHGAVPVFHVQEVTLTQSFFLGLLGGAIRPISINSKKV